jgi:hypothetical protein
MSNSKGLTIDECLNKAEEYIKMYGMCLFLLDVKGSKSYRSRQKLQDVLTQIMNDLNKEFNEYFPENNLATVVRKEKGFFEWLGDGAWVGINNSIAIGKIKKFLDEKYPEVSFYWSVAKDGYDEEGIKVVK